MLPFADCRRLNPSGGRCQKDSWPFNSTKDELTGCEEKANIGQAMGAGLRFDEIGYWSEVKLAILEEYAKPYNQILLSQKPKFHPIYIDGFAGAGHHIAKGSDRIVEGSPARALAVTPPFEFLHFVDIDGARADELRRLTAGRSNVEVYCGDCNEVLRNEVFPKIRWRNFERALCILDPYGLHLDWETTKRAGSSGVMDMFLNFPVMDMNMNVLWHDSQKVTDAQKERMTRFWGDRSWEDAAYQSTPGLFETFREKATNWQIAEAFRKRLVEVAGCVIAWGPSSTICFSQPKSRQQKKL
jgi:three-Cys-motif partner protein